MGDMEIPVPAFFADQIRDYITQGRKLTLGQGQNGHLLVRAKTKVISKPLDICTPI